MIGRLDNVIFDVADVPRLAEFYQALTGWSVSGDGSWMTLTLPSGAQISLQSAPDHVPPRWPDPGHPQQLHLDLLAGDIEATADRAVRLGATRLGATDTGGPRWVTLADPAGHPFDLCFREGSGDGVAQPLGLYAVTLDTEEPAALARFYTALLGMPVTWEDEHFVAIGNETGRVLFQKVDQHVRPQWPDPAHPQQGHIDVWVEDVEPAEAQVLALGATRLPGGGSSFRVYADPVGHPFCLIF